jgi:DnaK suppressor protein
MTGKPDSGAPRVSLTPEQVPVLPGEPAWTALELRQITGELLEELSRTAEEMRALEFQIADVLRDSGGGVGDDQADSGAKAFEREQSMTLLAQAQASQYQTERAIARLEAGGFGTCDACREPIGKLRLQAFPGAELCLNCKRRQVRH